MDVLLFLIFTNNTNNNTTYHNLNKCSLKYSSIKRFYTALHSVVSTVSYVCTWLLNSVIVLFSRQVPDWNLLHLYSVRYIKLKRLRTSNTYTSLCSFYIWILRPYWKVFLFETHANTHTHREKPETYSPYPRGISVLLHVIPIFRSRARTASPPLGQQSMMTAQQNLLSPLLPSWGRNPSEHGMATGQSLCTLDRWAKVNMGWTGRRTI